MGRHVAIEIAIELTDVSANLSKAQIDVSAQIGKPCLDGVKAAIRLSLPALQVGLPVLQVGYAALQVGYAALQVGLPALQIGLPALQIGLPALQVGLPALQVFEQREDVEERGFSHWGVA